MSAPRAPQRSVLLIGHSLYLAAIEAGLRAEPDVTVHRHESWSPALLRSATAPDAVIIDAIAAQSDLMAALVATFPELLVIELARGEDDGGQVLVRYGERRTVDTAQELARLITGAGPNR
jgi:hypothetical protein